MLKQVQLSDLISQFGGELVGDDVCVSRVNTLEKASEGEIGFLANPKYRKQLSDTKASAVIVSPDAVELLSGRSGIVTKNPYLYFARVTTFLAAPIPHPMGIDTSVVIDASVSLGKSVSIGAHVSIGAGATLGDQVVIHPGCRIAPGVSIGSGTILYPNVVVYHDCSIGEGCIVHAGAVIGSDGFGLAWAGEGWLKIPQIGRVLIGNRVEIGANTTIDRGAIDDTIIADGVKLDNQIQIAHNVKVGQNTAMAGCVGVAGSAVIGANCTLGGSAMILGHLELADGVNVMAGTLVGKSIRQPGVYTGQYPFQKHEDWLHNAAHLRRLDELSQKIKQLESALKQVQLTSANESQGQENEHD